MRLKMGKTRRFGNGTLPANRVGELVFDRRISMQSDPADPEGGFPPYFGDAYANPKGIWAENGILKRLAYPWVDMAVERGLPYSEVPNAIRISGGTTSIEQMIANCSEGIYIKHFGNVVLDPSDEGLRAGLMTGTTRDGCCFFVKDGQDRPAGEEFPIYRFAYVHAQQILRWRWVSRTARPMDIRRLLQESLSIKSYGRGDRRIIVPPMMILRFQFHRTKRRAPDQGDPIS